MKPFLQGRKVAESKSLPTQVSTSVLPVREQPKAVARTSAGPNVEVVKKGNKVTHVIVTCSCGEKIEVECLYTEGG